MSDMSKAWRAYSDRLTERQRTQYERAERSGQFSPQDLVDMAAEAAADNNFQVLCDNARRVCGVPLVPDVHEASKWFRAEPEPIGHSAPSRQLILKRRRIAGLVVDLCSEELIDGTRPVPTRIEIDSAADEWCSMTPTETRELAAVLIEFAKAADA